MVTFNPYPNRANKYFGLSTDTKPMDVPNASSYYEMDTFKWSLFDAENQRWIPQPNSSAIWQGGSY